MNSIKYWIGVASKEHVMRGVEGSFMQVCHGKKAPLMRMKKGDRIIYYSSKISMNGDEKCQCFTAIGEAADDNVYQVEMFPGFIPYRRNVRFYKCSEVSIIPLIGQLEFITSKKQWGYPFRYGFLEINQNDYDIIVSKMQPLDE